MPLDQEQALSDLVVDDDGVSGYLDPIELAGLTRIRHQEFALLDPGDVVEGEPDPDQV
ncbi:MAG: hypothetical protein ACRDU8_06330 [Egibacteraceae bacterium]